MKRLIIPVVLALLFAFLMFLLCLFVGWSHPSTWGTEGRIPAAFLIVAAGVIGSLLGTLIAEELK